MFSHVVEKLDASQAGEPDHGIGEQWGNAQKQFLVAAKNLGLLNEF